MKNALSLRAIAPWLGAVLVVTLGAAQGVSAQDVRAVAASPQGAVGPADAPSTGLKAPVQAPDGDLGRSALLKTDVEFSRTSSIKGMADAFLAYLADDAVLFPSNAGIVIGKDAIRKHFAGYEGVVLSWKPLKADVSTSGDLGYTYGTFEMRGGSEEGKSRISYGKYVSVWRKQPNGEWKLVADIGNASPAPGDAPAAP